MESKGHICWVKYSADSASFEFFARGSEVYQAPATSVIMTDGYRCGRWECSKAHFEHFQDTILERYESVQWKKGKRKENNS